MDERDYEIQRLNMTTAEERFLWEHGQMPGQALHSPPPSLPGGYVDPYAGVPSWAISQVQVTEQMIDRDGKWARLAAWRAGL